MIRNSRWPVTESYTIRRGEDTTFTPDVRNKLADILKVAECALYAASQGRHGRNPDLGILITQVKKEMVEYGVRLIEADDDLTCVNAARRTLKAVVS